MQDGTASWQLPCGHTLSLTLTIITNIPATMQLGAGQLFQVMRTPGGDWRCDLAVTRGHLHAHGSSSIRSGVSVVSNDCC